MMSDNVQGKLLQILSEIMSPRYILEIGTFTGFSAMCLVQGLQPQGELHTLELREEDAHTAQQFFTQSAYATQLKLHLGNAKDIIPHLPYEWDVVFIDADKVSYIEYYELTSVSYTHLDVYKRQGNNTYYYISVLWDLGKSANSPVSYTHLDVYKRQNLRWLKKVFTPPVLVANLCAPGFKTRKTCKG